MNEENKGPFDGAAGAGATNPHRHGDGGTPLLPRPPPSRRPRRQQQRLPASMSMSASAAVPAAKGGAASSSSSSSSSPPWADAVSGAVAALVALLVTYPMDVHKTRTQASPVTLKEDTGGADESEETVAGDEDDGDDDDNDDDAAGRRKRRRQRQRRRQRPVDSAANHWYAGWQTKVLHTSASSFCYFYLYGYLLALYKKNTTRTTRRTGSSEQKVSPSAHLLLSAAAAMLNTVVTLPLDVISSQQQVSCCTPRPFNCDDKVALNALLPAGISSSSSPSSSSPSSSLPRRVSELWRGLVPSLILCVNPAIHYTVYDALKNRWRKRQQQRNRQRISSSVSGPPPPQQLSVLEAFTLGVVAKFVATIVTYPLIRAKVLLMVGNQRSEEDDEVDANHGDRSYAEVAKETSLPASSSGAELIRCLISDYRANGIRGWYAGCTLQLLHTLFKSALLMAVREKIGSNAAWAAWFGKK